MHKGSASKTAYIVSFLSEKIIRPHERIFIFLMLHLGTTGAVLPEGFLLIRCFARTYDAGFTPHSEPNFLKR
jgi:hypothetical protein